LSLFFAVLLPFVVNKRLSLRLSASSGTGRSMYAAVPNLPVAT